MRDIIMGIFLLLIIASCNKPDTCLPCRIYSYEYNSHGNTKSDTSYLEINCDEKYLTKFWEEDLKNGWIKVIQKECN